MIETGGECIVTHNRKRWWMSNIKTVVVARGDGIGPEIMDGTLEVLRNAGAKLDFEFIDIGEKLYTQGISTGISNDAWAAIRRHKVLFKAPITTPQGKGYKSLNVTFRKALGLFANVRPVSSFQPFVLGPNSKIDIVIVRENEEDLYAGVEYRSTHNSYLSLKLLSRSGCERIIRYAFEYAKINQRFKVTCVIKDNIMKITDGLFHSVFKEVAKEYPMITADSYIVDIGAARIATKPEIFDVVVTLNLYGDILSDIAAEVSGSVGLAGSSNIGSHYAMFEAVHGSAPDIAGKGIANPSGLLNASVLMLNHLGQQEVAANIYNAWLKTIEDGMHTADIFNDNSKQKLSTQEFIKTVISNLGSMPEQLKAVETTISKTITIPSIFDAKSAQKEMMGVDVYLMDHNSSPEEVAILFNNADLNISLKSIAQRGLLIWPTANTDNVTTDMMRLRFIKREGSSMIHRDISTVLELLQQHGFEISLFHTLYKYDGVEGFSKTQGE